MKQLKSHVRHDDPEIMPISHIHVLLLFSAISFIVSLTLPSWSPVLVPPQWFLDRPHRLNLSLPWVWSISNVPVASPERLHHTVMENVAFHRLLRWKMIILPTLTTSPIHFSLKGWENVCFERVGVKGLIPIMGDWSKWRPFDENEKVNDAH